MHKQHKYEVLLFHSLETEVNQRLQHREVNIIQPTSCVLEIKSWH